MRILIVDDEESLRKVIELIFIGKGYSCLFARNGAEAIEVLLSDGRIDVVITDINMPVMNGLDLTRWIRINRNKTAVLVMTGLGDTYAAEEAMKAGADDFILKPFKALELYLRVEKVMELMTTRIALERGTENLKKLSAEMISGVQKDAQDKISVLESEMSKYIPATKEPAVATWERS